jgi:hypothetical protein
MAAFRLGLLGAGRMGRTQTSAARRQWVAVGEITGQPRDIRLDG